MRSNGSVPLTCARCGAAFTVPAYRAQTAHYCGRACADLGRRGQPSARDQRVTLRCEACGVAFKYQAGKAAGRRFCSRACSKGQKRHIGERPRDPNKREMRLCQQCGASFEYWAARAHPFCSRRCYVAHRASLRPERFWSHVNKNGPVPPHRPELGPCWLWTGATTGKGYGSAGYGTRHEMAHRLAWELTYGAIKDDLWVLHKCDNPPCCNPAHLFLGTLSDNMLDMVAKGRRDYARKLNPEAVRRIRTEGTRRGAQTRLAHELGVTVSSICDVLKGRTWKHVQ